jgi:alpha-glucoside transport system permease protein
VRAAIGDRRIAAYGIFQFLWVWNDLLMALVFVQRGEWWPMTKAIQNLLSQYGTEWHCSPPARSS